MLEQKKNHAPNHRIHETENVSPLFDSALPESLLFEGIQNKSTSSPRIYIGQEAKLSPYIIQLSREEASQTEDPDPIVALEANLLQSADLFAEDSDDMEEESLEVTLDSLHEQLREFDIQPKKVVPQTLNSFHEPALPSEAPLSVHVPESFIEETLPKHVETHITPVATSTITTPSKRKKKKKVRKPLKISFSVLTFQTKALASFVVLSLLVVGPIHAMQGFGALPNIEQKTTELSKGALSSISSAADAISSADFTTAETNFSQAESAFSDAENTIGEVSDGITLLVNIIPQTNRTFDSVTNLITAGKSLSESARLFAKAADEIQVQNDAALTDKFLILDTYFAQIAPQLAIAEQALARVDSSIVPTEYQSDIQELQKKTPAILKSVQEFNTYSAIIQEILGAEMDKRYLITFQNNTELRATGGFVGSYAQIDLSKGAIKEMNIPGGGSYDIQGQLRDFVEAPEPLQLINPRWEFQDANWFPDFRLSARKMIDFYDAAGGPTVDGLIAINASVLPELLTVLGPIDMPAYERTLHSDNILFEMQKIVENEYSEYAAEYEQDSPSPKQFIGDITPIIVERIGELDMQSLLRIADILIDNLSQSEIQFFFTDNDLQANIEDLGWAGKQLPSSLDYLQVINTNIGGGKTDGIIDQDIHLQIEIQEDGSLINTVQITKTHRGLRSALFEGQNNVDYIRLYVPQGSLLLEANGFEIPPEELFQESSVPLYADEDLDFIMSDKTKHQISGTDIWNENGKTVFGNWVQTKPGETEELTFTYQLPFTLDLGNSNTILDQIKYKIGLRQLETYSLLVQKQSGVKKRETNVQVILPSGKVVVWSSHDQGENILLDNSHNETMHFLIETLK